VLLRPQLIVAERNIRGSRPLTPWPAPEHRARRARCASLARSNSAHQAVDRPALARGGFVPSI